jgi:CRP/FNR family cyclic AMP-dependent transcriptional regulator
MNAVENMINNFPIFQELEHDELREVTALCIERKYQKGNIIFFEGDCGEECYFIHSGTVRIFRFDESKEITLALLRKGDYFGEMAMLSRGLARSATAEVIETSHMYSLNRADFIRFLESNPKLCMKMLEITMQRLRKTNEQIYDLTFFGLKSRILKILMRLADEHGIASGDSVVIPIKLTHQQLADMVGAMRESVSKILYELQDNEFIKVEDKLVTILKLNEFKSIM